MKGFFSDKRILVTGACGTVGSELVRQLIEDHRAGEVVGIDNNETELFFLEQRFAAAAAHFYLGDVRDGDKLVRKMRGIDIVFHTAAFKHVLLCERSPYEAVQTNILGVQNVVYAAMENRVARVVFTSSDKAVNPTSVMGTSKLMGERLMTAANNHLRAGGPIFVSTRFGNVLGSRGSVIPIFREQIRRGGPVTLTDPGMTRFIMSIREAVQLVIDSAVLACGGEVFITKMPVIRICDLARAMIRELAPAYGHRPDALAIKTIGIQPGEKMYEELMNREETRRAWELARYFVVLPAVPCSYRRITYDYPEIRQRRVERPYHSDGEPALGQEDLVRFLKDNDLMHPSSEPAAHPAERYWPAENS